MQKSLVLDGPEVAKIVASFLHDNGYSIKTFNTGGHTVTPMIEICANNSLIPLDTLKIHIGIDDTKRDSSRIEEISDKIRKLI